MAETELKSCPFCGCEYIEQYKSLCGGSFVRCCECGAEVGSPNCSQEAILAWNRRIDECEEFCEIYNYCPHCGAKMSQNDSD